MNNIYFVLICPCLPYVFMYIYMRAVCMYVYKFPHMDVCMHARTPADCLYKHSADNTRSPTQDRAVIVFEALGHFKECSLYVCDKQPFTPNSVCSQARCFSWKAPLSLSLLGLWETIYSHAVSSWPTHLTPGLEPRKKMECSRIKTTPTKTIPLRLKKSNEKDTTPTKTIPLRLRLRPKI